MRGLAFGALLVTFFALGGQSVLGCECVRTGPDDAFSDFQSSDIVFVGEVLDARRVEVPVDAQRHTLELEVRLKVKKGLKGVKDKEVVLRTGPGLGGDCGFPFEKGKKYLVFAYVHTGRIGTDGCTRTKLFSYAAQDLKEIKQGGRPIKTEPSKLGDKIVTRP